MEFTLKIDEESIPKEAKILKIDPYIQNSSARWKSDDIKTPGDFRNFMAVQSQKIYLLTEINSTAKFLLNKTVLPESDRGFDSFVIKAKYSGATGRATFINAKVIFSIPVPQIFTSFGKAVGYGGFFEASWIGFDDIELGTL